MLCKTAHTEATPGLLLLEWSSKHKLSVDHNSLLIHSPMCLVNLVTFALNLDRLTNLLQALTLRFCLTTLWLAALNWSSHKPSCLNFGGNLSLSCNYVCLQVSFSKVNKIISLCTCVRLVWNRVKIREKVQRYEGGTGRVRNVCRDL